MMEEQDRHVCKTCVLKESSIIRIEDNGNCNICNSKDFYSWIYNKPSEDKLRMLIDKIKNDGKKTKYDCIVGLSGGRDSTSLIYELTKVHGLKCAAIFFKTPFTPPEIVENVHSLAEKLKFYLIEKETPGSHLEIASYCLKLYSDNKLPVMINLACSPCKFLNLEVLKHAKSMKIKYVIYGGNPFEYIPLSPVGIEINSKNRFSLLTMLKDNILRIKKGIGILYHSPKLIKYLPAFFKASVLYVNFYTIFLRLRFPKIQRLDYYLYADWDEKRINMILNEIGWKLPKGCNSTWRADCAFEAVKNITFKNNLGFTYTHAMLSNLIRANKITRSEAILRLERETISEIRLNEVLRLCNVTDDIFLPKMP